MSRFISPLSNPSTADAEKILRSIMIADSKVLRRRSDNEGDRLTPEGRDAIRAARQRHKLKSQPAIVPPIAEHRRKNYG
jgi:hypothetical protein